jgi:hypothetical protein
MFVVAKIASLKAAAHLDCLKSLGLVTILSIAVVGVAIAGFTPPSITDSACAESCSFQSTFQSDANVPVRYTVTTVVSADVAITVTPTEFTIQPSETQTLDIDVDVTAVPFDEWRSVSIRVDGEALSSASYAATTAGGPTFHRPFTIGDGTSGSCSLSGAGSNVAYHTREFSVAVSGSYSVSSAQDYDGYIHVYEGGFNPADACANLIALDDDGGVGSLIPSVNLIGTQSYTLVTSGFSNFDSGNFTNVVTGPGSITLDGEPPSATPPVISQTVLPVEVRSVDPTPRMAINAGDGQTAVAGEAVAVAPSVLVTDANDNPVEGVSVVFAVASGGGSVTGASANTDANGIATVGGWTLGTAVGTNTLTATAIGLTGSPVTFNASAENAPPTAPVITAPPAGANIDIEGLITDVLVLTWTPSTDINDDPLTYTWQLAADTQFLTVLLSVPTISDTQLTLTYPAVEQVLLGAGASLGDSITLFHRVIANDGTVAVEGPASEVTLTLGKVAGPASQMEINAGDGQSEVVGEVVATAPSVLVTDANDNPVEGIAVTFAVASGGGSVTGASATTNASGIAMVGSWTLGTTAGENTLTATSTGLTGSPLTFTATGTATAPSGPLQVQVEPSELGLIVSWVAPGDNGGSPILSYRAEANPSCEVVALADEVPGETPYSCTIGNLDPEREYIVTVTAINAAGESAATAAAAARPLQAIPIPTLGNWALLALMLLMLAMAMPALIKPRLAA